MKLTTHYPDDRPDARSPGNWRENSLSPSLYYSYRSTHYTRRNYPSKLHYHDYYELVVFVEGSMHYLCEGDLYTPVRGDVMLIPPGRLHRSAPDAEEMRYTRHVFYLYPDALDALAPGLLAQFLPQGAAMAAGRVQEETLGLLAQLDAALLSGDPVDRALAGGLLIQIFCHFARCGFTGACDNRQLPRQVRALQRYLDEHFATIRSVADVAQHFYYSREYVARLFKKHFNTTVSDYLNKRRIAHAQMLIASGTPPGEAAMQSGFATQGTFIRTFKSIAGMTPSEWKKQKPGA